MNEEIMLQLRFFAISILWGAIVLLTYDGFRILRRLKRHGNIMVAIEDILFWIAAGLFIFAMIYQVNDGIIRGFCVMGMAIGMVLYHFTLSELLVKWITKLIQLLLKPIGIAIGAIRKVAGFVLGKIKKAVKFIIIQLKKKKKSIKITKGEDNKERAGKGSKERTKKKK
ncbi:MAG TPA: hypothetical protein GXX75_16100 [Clostridiales bacterium]|nr:hypothetical protein [Clostridiales bacterium]